MDLREKMRLQRDEEKDRRKEDVLKAAITVFRKSGIERSKMQDFADAAEVGIASVYRYFNNKSEIVIAAATRMWDEEIANFISNFNERGFYKLNGISRVEKILLVFVQVYEDDKQFMRFIEEFDNYIVNENIPREKLKCYEMNILSLMPVMIDALEVGKMDGSINKKVDNNIFYITITHTLISLCQKLILRKNVLNCDEFVSGEAQIKLVIEMALKYLER